MIIKELIYGGSRYSNVDSENTDLPSIVVEQAVIDQKWSEIRQRRNALVSGVDYTQMPDSPLTAEQKTAWAEYRQALRDIPDVYDDPDDVVWPEKPTL